MAAASAADANLPDTAILGTVPEPAGVAAPDVATATSSVKLIEGKKEVSPENLATGAPLPEAGAAAAASVFPTEEQPIAASAASGAAVVVTLTSALPLFDHFIKLLEPMSVELSREVAGLYRILLDLYGDEAGVNNAYQSGTLNKTPLDPSVYSSLIAINEWAQSEAEMIGSDTQERRASADEFGMQIKSLTKEYQAVVAVASMQLFLEQAKAPAADPASKKIAANFEKLLQVAMELNQRFTVTGQLLGYERIASQDLAPIFGNLRSYCAEVVAQGGHLQFVAFFSQELARVNEQGLSVSDVLQRYEAEKTKAAAEQEAIVAKQLAAAGQHYLVIGDLHGDVPALAHHLFHPKGAAGFALLRPAEAFDELVQAYDALRFEWYRKPKVSSQDKAARIVDFYQILQHVELTPEVKDITLRLLGDLFHERGANDFFMLLFLERLKELGLPIQITASNHDAHLFETFSVVAAKDFSARAKDQAYKILDDLGLPSYAHAVLHPKSVWLTNPFNAFCFVSQARSAVEMLHLFYDPAVRKVLIAGGVLKESDDLAALRARFETLFKSNLRLLACDVVGEGEAATLRLYTHAPVPATVVFDLADALKISYSKDDTAVDSARMIEKINEAFMARLHAFELLAAASSSLGLDDLKGLQRRFGAEDALLLVPLYKVIWSRYADYRGGGQSNFSDDAGWLKWMDRKDDLARLPAWTRDGKWQLVHGHDAKGKGPDVLINNGRVFNVDSLVGHLGPLHKARLPFMVAPHQGKENALFIPDPAVLLPPQKPPIFPVEAEFGGYLLPAPSVLMAEEEGAGEEDEYREVILSGTGDAALDEPEEFTASRPPMSLEPKPGGAGVAARRRRLSAAGRLELHHVTSGRGGVLAESKQAEQAAADGAAASAGPGAK